MRFRRSVVGSKAGQWSGRNYLAATAILSNLLAIGCKSIVSSLDLRDMAITYIHYTTYCIEIVPASSSLLKRNTDSKWVSGLTSPNSNNIFIKLKGNQHIWLKTSTKSSTYCFRLKVNGKVISVKRYPK